MKKYSVSFLVGIFADLVLTLSPILYQVFEPLDKITGVIFGISVYFGRLLSVNVNNYQIPLLGLAYLAVSLPFFGAYLLTPWFRKQARVEIHRFSFLFFSFL